MITTKQQYSTKWTRNPYSGTPQDGPAVPLESELTGFASEMLAECLDYFIVSSWTSTFSYGQEIGWLAPVIK